MPQITVTTEEVQPVEIKDPQTLVADTGLLRDQVAMMFDMKPSEISENKDRLNTLIEYAKLKTDDHSPEGIKWALRSLGIKLGTPPLGEKLIRYLHIYAKLYLDGKRIEQQKEQFLKGDKD